MQHNSNTAPLSDSKLVLCNQKRPDQSPFSSFHWLLLNLPVVQTSQPCLGLIGSYKRLIWHRYYIWLDYCSRCVCLVFWPFCMCHTKLKDDFHDIIKRAFVFVWNTMWRFWLISWFACLVTQNVQWQHKSENWTLKGLRIKRTFIKIQESQQQIAYRQTISNKYANIKL